MEEVDDYIASMGESIKSNPLRQEYETAVQNLSSYENQLRCQGLGDEEIARLMYEARRNLGIEYKDLTHKVGTTAPYPLARTVSVEPPPRTGRTPLDVSGSPFVYHQESII